MRAVGSLWSLFVHAYDAVQVEARGSYSVERIQELQAFAASHSRITSALVLAATPLPCVAIAILVDAVPLNRARLGLAHSHWFWWRVALVVACVTFTLLEQLLVFVPRLARRSTLALLAMSVVIGVGCAAYGLLLASYVGYPLPFTLLFGSPSWQVLFWIGVAIQWGRQLRHDRALRGEVVAFYKVVLVQLSLTAVYPAYNHVFSRLHGWSQTVFALGLSVLKLLAKNAFHRVFQHAEDFLPEVVVFNVEIFHALFVATCMQTSTSFSTTLAVIVADLVQIWAHIRDVDAILNVLRRLEDKTPHAGSAFRPPPLTTALIYVSLDESLQSDPGIRLPTMSTVPVIKKTGSPGTFGAVLPLEATSVDRAVSPAPELLVVAKLQHLRRTFVAHELDQLKQTLSHDERRTYFLVLIEFVEVVVPLVYSLYLVAIAQMSNRAFYPQLDGLDAHGLRQTVGSIAAYTSLELATFIGLCIVLQRKLKLSPITQLAFVLRRYWKLVQSKMVLWVVVIVGISLEQFGYDYTFQFAWLKTK